MYVDQTFKNNFLFGTNFTFAEKLQKIEKEYLYTLHPPSSSVNLCPFCVKPFKNE